MEQRDACAAYFETRYAPDPRRDVVWREVCRYLQGRHIPPTATVVDLGAGYCNFVNNIRGREKHAVDVFPRLPEYAADDVAAHVHTCTSMEMFGDATLDVAFASNLLEHLTRDDTLATLREVGRILKPGGRFLMLQPNFRLCYRTYFDDPTHLQIFTDRGLRDLLEAEGFRVVEVQKRFLPVNMKSTLRFTPPALPLIVRLYLSLPFRPWAGQMLLVAEPDGRAGS